MALFRKLAMRLSIVGSRKLLELDRNIGSENAGFVQASKNCPRASLRGRWLGAPARVIVCHSSTSLPQYSICTLWALNLPQLPSAMHLSWCRST